MDLDKNIEQLGYVLLTYNDTSNIQNTIRLHYNETIVLNGVSSITSIISSTIACRVIVRTSSPASGTILLLVDVKGNIQLLSDVNNANNIFEPILPMSLDQGKCTIQITTDTHLLDLLNDDFNVIRTLRITDSAIYDYELPEECQYYVLRVSQQDDFIKSGYTTKLMIALYDEEAANHNRDSLVYEHFFDLPNKNFINTEPIPVERTCGYLSRLRMVIINTDVRTTDELRALNEQYAHFKHSLSDDYSEEVFKDNDCGKCASSDCTLNLDTLTPPPCDTTGTPQCDTDRVVVSRDSIVTNEEDDVNVQSNFTPNLNSTPQCGIVINDTAAVVSRDSNSSLLTDDDDDDENCVEKWSYDRLVKYIKINLPNLFVDSNDRNVVASGRVRKRDWPKTREPLVRLVSNHIESQRKSVAGGKVVAPLKRIYDRAAKNAIFEDPSSWSLVKLRDYLKVNEPTYVGRTTRPKSVLVEHVKWLMRKAYNDEMKRQRLNAECEKGVVSLAYNKYGSDTTTFRLAAIKRQLVANRDNDRIPTLPVSLKQMSAVCLICDVERTDWYFVTYFNCGHTCVCKSCFSKLPCDKVCAECDKVVNFTGYYLDSSGD